MQLIIAWNKLFITWLVNSRIIMKHLSRISVRINRKYDVRRRYGGSSGENVRTLVIDTYASLEAYKQLFEKETVRELEYFTKIKWNYTSIILNEGYEALIAPLETFKFPLFLLFSYVFYESYSRTSV